MSNLPKWAIPAGIGTLVLIVAASVLAAYMQNATQQESIAKEYSRDKNYLEILNTAMQQIQKDETDTDNQYLQFLSGNDYLAANSFSDYLSTEASVVENQSNALQGANPYSASLQGSQLLLKVDYSSVESNLTTESTFASAEEGRLILSNYKYVDSSFRVVLQGIRSNLTMFAKYNAPSY